MFSGYPDMVTVKDMCIMLRISKNTAYKLIKNNEIETLKLGNKIVTSKAKVIDFIHGKTV